MPTPIELTALLLAGSITTGDPEMDTYLIESALEAKHRNIVVEGYDDFSREYFVWEVGRVIGLHP